MTWRHHSMNDKRLLRIGFIGAVGAALCCFTPLLVGLLALLGLGAVTGYLDYVLLPALAGFLALTGYGLLRRKQETTPPCCVNQPGADERL